MMRDTTPAGHDKCVDVQIAANHGAAPDADDLRRWAENALQGEAGGVCVRIVGGREGATLNKRFRGIAAATNVLSFAADVELPRERSRRGVDARIAAPIGTDSNSTSLDGPLHKHWGDVVICAPVVEAEALQQSKPTTHHYAHMVVHGVLHLRGFDHKTEPEAQKMESLETRILGDLGISDPYVGQEPAQ